MEIETLTVRASCTIPTQQYGNVSLHVEAIATLFPGDDPTCCTRRLMNGIHGALAQTVRERLDPTDPAVARWLDVVDPDDNPLWPTNIQPPPPPLSAVLREAQDAAKDAADHNGGADQQGRGVQP